IEMSRKFRQDRLHAIEQLENREAANEEGGDHPRKAGTAATKRHRQLGNQIRSSNAAGPMPIAETSTGRKNTNIAIAMPSVAQAKASRHGRSSAPAASASAGPRQTIEG